MYLKLASCYFSHALSTLLLLACYSYGDLLRLVMLCGCDSLELCFVTFSVYYSILVLLWLLDHYTWSHCRWRQWFVVRQMTVDKRSIVHFHHQIQVYLGRGVCLTISLLDFKFRERIIKHWSLSRKGPTSDVEYCLITPPWYMESILECSS